MMREYGVAQALAPYYAQTQNELSLHQGQKVYVNLSTARDAQGRTLTVPQSSHGWTKAETISNGDPNMPKRVGYVPTEYIKLVDLVHVNSSSPTQTNTASVSQSQSQSQSQSNSASVLQPLFKKREKVYHQRKQMLGTVEAVHTDDPEGPYYTVILENGNHLQATQNNLQKIS